jgi:hypothetical protein
MDENDFDELAQVGAEHKRELLQAALPGVAGLRGCTVKASLDFLLVRPLQTLAHTSTSDSLAKALRTSTANMSTARCRTQTP